MHSSQTGPASSASRQAQPHPGCQNKTVPPASAPESAKDEALAPQTPVTSLFTTTLWPHEGSQPTQTIHDEVYISFFMDLNEDVVFRDA